MYNQTQQSGINVTAKQETKTPVSSCIQHTELLISVLFIIISIIILYNVLYSWISNQIGII